MPDMTPEAFILWLDDIKATGLVKTDAEAGRLIGKNQNSMVNYKTRGADKTVALACAAVLAGIPPYSQVI